MILNNAPTDCQPEAHPTDFRGEKRLEDSIGLVWIDAWSGVLHRQQNRGMPVDAGRYRQVLAIRRPCTHRFDSVFYQI
jgi:hypothetical protein